MLNRLSSVWQSAADALAPPPTPIEDLKYHWNRVMRFHAQRSIQSECPIEETNILPHLEQLLQILISEGALTENVGVEGPYTIAAPCLEFLLQHRLLDLLASLARADSPPGMRRYLIDHFRRFVTTMSAHLLTLSPIRRPLLRIIRLCRQNCDMTEEERGFLTALDDKMEMHPYLSIIFDNEFQTEFNKPSNSSRSVSSSNQFQSDSSPGQGLMLLGQGVPGGPEFGEDRLPLLNAVLDYINSADSAIKLHVCNALLMMVSVTNETFSSAVAHSRKLGLGMAEKLTSSFQDIPSDIDLDHCEDIPQNWGPKSLPLWIDQNVFPGNRIIASFVSWLNIYDHKSRRYNVAKAAEQIVHCDISGCKKACKTVSGFERHKIVHDITDANSCIPSFNGFFGFIEYLLRNVLKKLIEDSRGSNSAETKFLREVAEHKLDDESWLNFVSSLATPILSSLTGHSNVFPQNRYEEAQGKLKDYLSNDITMQTLARELQIVTEGSIDLNTKVTSKLAFSMATLLFNEIQLCIIKEMRSPKDRNNPAESSMSEEERSRFIGALCILLREAYSKGFLRLCNCIKQKFVVVSGENVKSVSSEQFLDKQFWEPDNKTVISVNEKVVDFFEFVDTQLQLKNPYSVIVSRIYSNFTLMEEWWSLTNSHYSDKEAAALMKVMIWRYRIIFRSQRKGEIPQRNYERFGIE